MGLLDMLGAGLDDPRNIAALRMGGLISQGAIGQTRPTSLFGLLGQGAGAYSDTMRQARADELRSQEAQMRKDEFGLRRQQYEQELAAAQEQRQMAERQQQAASDWLMNFRTGAYGNHLEAAQDAAFRGISEVPSVKAALSTLAPPTPIKADKDARLVVPDGQGGFRTVLDALPEAPKLPSGMRMGPGGPEWIPGYLEGQQSVAAAGASPGARIEVKTGDSLASQVGPALRAGRTQVEGAMKTANSADMLLKAIDSGSAIVGPGSSWRMLGAQLAAMAGLPDAQKAVVETRKVIRALSETAVEARKELAGQGQVTENEARAVEKAQSGQIDELTVDEIKLIAELNKKAAGFRAKMYAEQLNAIPQQLKPFYYVPGMESLLPYYQPPAPGGNDIDALLKKYGG